MYFVKSAIPRMIYRSTPTMCDMDDVSIVINWCGWKATINELKAEGWVFSKKPKYPNSPASSDYLYLRHPVMKMVGKLKYTEGTCYSLEFLYHEKNGIIKPPRFVDQRDYSEEDIEPMLEAIITIQQRRPRRRSALPVADILNYSKFSKQGAG